MSTNPEKMPTEWPTGIAWGDPVEVMDHAFTEANWRGWVRGFVRHLDGSLCLVIENPIRVTVQVPAYKCLIVRPPIPAGPQLNTPGFGLDRFANPPAGGIDRSRNPWWGNRVPEPAPPAQEAPGPEAAPTEVAAEVPAPRWSDDALIDDIQFGNKRVDGKVQTACTLMGLTTVGDARRVKDKHFLRLPNFGPESLAFLRAVAPFNA